MGTSDGHRQRLKERFEEHGLDNFNDVNVLELLLFYALPRGDTNPTAHRLLDRFGSLWEVFDASEEELMSVPGIGKNAAVLLKLIPPLTRRYLMSLEDPVITFNTLREVGRYFIPRFLFLKDEELHLLCMDDMNRMLRCDRLFTGVSNAAEISIRKIAEVSLRCGATKIVLAHNHPNGVALPSPDDIRLTEQIEKALQPLGIRLLDHIVVGGNDYVSILSDSSYMRRP